MIDLTITASWDGSQQLSCIVEPAGYDPSVGGDLLIALHGHGADRRQFVEDPRDECRAVREIAAKRGLLLVAPDYRAPDSWMGPAATADLGDLITCLRREREIGALILCGGSMGAAASLAFAVMHPELVQGVVAMNGVADMLEFSNFQEAIRRSYGGAKEDVPHVYRARSAALHPQVLTMPLRLTIGGQDQSTPPASVRRLVAALAPINPRVRLLDRENEGHRTSYEDACDVLEFVRGQVCDHTPNDGDHDGA